MRDDLNLPRYAAPSAGFKSRKAAQVCAWLALKSEGSTIEKLKLIKLVYLCERNFLARYHFTMLCDDLFSLPHGPICSATLNGINGVIHAEIWRPFLTMNGNLVVAARKLSRDQFDEISDAEIEILEEIWTEFGHKTASQLRNYSHQHCPEYTGIDYGRSPISYRDILKSLGDPDADEIDQEIRNLQQAESILAA